MTIAKNFGRQCYHLKSEDDRKRFRMLLINKIEADVKKQKEQLEMEFRFSSEKEKRLLAELEYRKNVPPGVLRENFFRGMWDCFLLIICSIGEFVFASWMIKYFGLSVFETHLVAATIVVISLKAFDHYLTAFRQRYPQAENTIFLLTSFMGIVPVFLLIFFGALIRQELNMATTATSLSGHLEEIVRQANQFYEKNTGNYLWMMVTLTVAFVVVGGISYHVAKARISMSIPYLSLYRSLKKVRNDMLKLGKAISAQNSRIAGFTADFESGFVEAQVAQAQKESTQNTMLNNSQKVKKKYELGPIVFNPLIVIVIAVLIFLFLIGKANGAQQIILLDISKSVDVKDYSQKETAFQKNVTAIEDFIRHHISPGDYLKIIGITENSFSQPYYILDSQISKDKGAFGEGLAREKLASLNKWKKQNLQANAEATDIFGAVNLAAISFLPNEPQKNLIIFSDMRQCAYGINFERPEKIQSEIVLKKIEQLGLIPEMKGVTVSCLGVHSAGKTPVYWSSMKEFWTRYFTRAKATLLIFSMERRIPK